MRMAKEKPQPGTKCTLSDGENAKVMKSRLAIARRLSLFRIHLQSTWRFAKSEGGERICLDSKREEIASRKRRTYSPRLCRIRDGVHIICDGTQVVDCIKPK